MRMTTKRDGIGRGRTFSGGLMALLACLSMATTLEGQTNARPQSGKSDASSAAAPSGAASATGAATPVFSPEVEAARAAARAAGVTENFLPVRTLAELLERKRNAAPWEGKINGFVRDRMDRLEIYGVLAPGQRHRAPEFATEEVAIDAQARLKVECRVVNELNFDAAFFASIGGQLVDVAPGYGLLIAWIPCEQIPAFAQRPDVKRVMEVDPPRCNTGSINSQGDAIHRANIVRDLLGVTGAGQKVGAISDGVSSLASAQATGDLPAMVDVPMDCTGSGDEGTAMLEIIFDLAPGADLAFCGVGGGATTFVNAINKLVLAGCTVITDDLIAGAEPLYENGPVANAKIAAAAAGVYYTCSAGNRGNQHYHGNFNNGGTLTIGGFSRNRCHNFGGGDQALSITLAASNSIRLQWAEPFGGAGIDIDLYIVDNAGNILAQAIDIQDGDDDPQEAVSFNVGAGQVGTLANIVVQHFTSPSTTTFFDVRAFGGVGWNEFLIPEGSLDPVARQPEIHVDGAANATSPNTVVGFSSRGPALRFFPAPASFLKPDAISINGVSVTGAGCFACPAPCPPANNCTFFGTSASTPHAAALAAMVLEVNPAFNPAQVMTRLDTNAIDIDAPGNDNNAGWGRLDALRAVLNCSTDNSPPTVGTCSFPGGNLSAATCSITIPYSVTVLDDRCLQVDNVSASAAITGGAATLSAPAPTRTQVSATEVSITGSVTVSAATACPVVVSINISATDCCDNAANLVCSSGNILDVTPPQTTVTITNPVQPVEVDGNCEATITFRIDVTDNCCLNPATVLPNVTATVTTANAVVSNLVTSPPIVNGPTSITINGSVLVSQLTSCPATVRISATGRDCCGNTQTNSDTVDVVDLIPPQITCPPPLLVEDGAKLCNPQIQQWLDSATATDNCDTNVAIVNDSAAMGFACGFPCGTTTTVTWTATDDCGNTASCSSTITVLPCPVTNTTQKGSLLVWPEVEIKWTAAGQLSQETFLTLTNDLASSGVRVKLYMVNGDMPIPPFGPGAGSVEPGWNFLNNVIELTHDQPRWWAASTGKAGLQTVVSPFTALDANGRTLPDGTRRLRGFVLGWALNNNGREIRFNHLAGGATIVNYVENSAWDYTAWAYQARCVAHGAEPLDCTAYDANGVCCVAGVVPGNLDLDGFQYERTPSLLLLDFFAAGTSAFGVNAAGQASLADTQLTVMPMIHDFSPTRPPEPPITDIQIDVWNQDEVKLTNQHRCLQCWDSTLLSLYNQHAQLWIPGGIVNHFALAALGSAKGKARLQGLPNVFCQRAANPNASPPDPGLLSVTAPLLGVSHKIVQWGAAPADVGRFGEPLGTMGHRADGRVRFTAQPDDPPEAGLEFPAVENLIHDGPASSDFKPLAPPSAQPEIDVPATGNGG